MHKNILRRTKVIVSKFIFIYLIENIISTFIPLILIAFYWTTLQKQRERERKKVECRKNAPSRIRTENLSITSLACYRWTDAHVEESFLK